MSIPATWRVIILPEKLLRMSILVESTYLSTTWLSLAKGPGAGHPTMRSLGVLEHNAAVTYCGMNLISNVSTVPCKVLPRARAESVGLL